MQYELYTLPLTLIRLCSRGVHMYIRVAYARVPYARVLYARGVGVSQSWQQRLLAALGSQVTIQIDFDQILVCSFSTHAITACPPINLSTHLPPDYFVRG